MKIFRMFGACAVLLYAGASFGELPLSGKEVPGEVEGVVTFVRNWDVWFFIRNATGEYWRVETPDCQSRPKLSEGDIIRATGVFPANCTGRRLNKAVVEIVGKGEIVPPVKRTIAELYATGPDGEKAHRDWQGEIIELRGIVLDINRRESFAQILVAEGDKTMMVSVPVKREKPLPPGIEIGAAIAATGVGVYAQKIDGPRRMAVDVTDLGLQCHGSESLRPLAAAPFWTPLKIGAALAGFAILAAISFAWAFVLKRDKARDQAAADAIRRERLRLTSELHDNFQQLLAGCMFCLGAVSGKVGKDDAGAKEQLELLRNSLNHTQASLRAALWGLAEEAEGPEALTELFKYAASRMPQWEGIVHFSMRGRERPIARACSGVLLLILQEAIGNALRHGRASRVDVVVDFPGDALVFGIKDNGCGFEPKDFTETGHLGLDSMRRHAEGIGGTFNLKSAPGEGTIIVVRIPL